MNYWWFNPLSALLTYTHMSLCRHRLECCVDIYVYIVVLVKIFWWTFFLCLLFREGTHWKANRNTATIIHAKNNTPFRWKKEKNTIDLNVSSQGVNWKYSNENKQPKTAEWDFSYHFLNFSEFQSSMNLHTGKLCACKMCCGVNMLECHVLQECNRY